MKKISIITINYNNSVGLTNTLKSVINQSYTNYEYIVIDGGSTDGSKQIIEEYAPHLSYWVSEEDKGIYHAMNKGVCQAEGEYLLFLNSGDYLEPEILAEVARELTGEDIIYGDLYFIFENTERRLQKYDTSLTATRFLSSDFSLPHPASFIKKELFLNGMYSENYLIVSDWEFFIKNIILKDCTTKHISIGVSNFLDGGISSTNPILTKEERLKVLNNLFPTKVYNDLLKLSIIERSPLCDIIPQLNHTRKFQKRMKRLIVFLFKLNQAFKRGN
nr:glycosyltransferase family 2 protein [uncultured Bacteroides sp.]